MFYAIWRNSEGRVGGFILDDFEEPQAWNSETEAREAIRGHMFEFYSEIIEL